MRASVHSGAYSIPSHKASPLNSKRRSKNERKLLTGINTNNGYKNPYLLQLENIKSPDEDDIYPIEKPLVESTIKKRNNVAKHSKTNPISDKKLKSETPRGNSTSPRFEQAAIE